MVRRPRLRKAVLGGGRLGSLPPRTTPSVRSAPPSASIAFKKDSRLPGYRPRGCCRSWLALAGAGLRGAACLRRRAGGLGCLAGTAGGEGSQPRRQQSQRLPGRLGVAPSWHRQGTALYARLSYPARETVPAFTLGGQK